MDKDEILNLVKPKNHLMHSFWHTLSRDPGKDPKDFLLFTTTGYFLRHLILELMIKILFELDNRKQAPTNHRIFDQFKKLKEKTQRELIENYDKARNREDTLIKKRGENKVLFPPFQTVLQVNPKVVVAFKYDAKGRKENFALDYHFMMDIHEMIQQRLKQL